MEKLFILFYFLQSKLRRFSSRTQLLKWQQHKIKRHLKWVCQHSEFYKDYKNKPLNEFPIMNKSIMMENFNALNTANLDKAELFELALNAEKTRQFDQSIINSITVGLSTGTSGQRGLFLASKNERVKWTGTIFAKLLPNLKQKHRIALLLRADSPLYQTAGKGRIQFHYADVTQPLEQWLAQLVEFNPTVIVGSAQAIQLCAQHKQGLNPTTVISAAEVLTAEDEAFIEQAFNKPVKQIYQCTEGFLACSDSNNIMRWNEDNIHIEPHWLNEEKTHYSPIITDFRRKTQPIIRYLLDDIIEAGEDSGVFKSIKSISGRCGDRLHLQNQKTSAIILPDLIYRAVSYVSDELIDYRITQTQRNTVVIESDKLFFEIKESLSELFYQQGISHTNFLCKDAPVWNLNEKRRRVVNQVVALKQAES
ncbi:F390 synthetase-related protein [Marinicellulosiphila megalodicopiae]|uniref:F390 synthetase-related protein n=1 Tax=Marinicellulosiphila megalodicopiae TaxID=2724896 RepID=UPI003BAF9074